MHSRALLAALVGVWLAGGVARADEHEDLDDDRAPIDLTQSCRLDIRLEVVESGALHVHETIRLDLAGEAPPPLTRQVWLRPAPGMFPLRQRVVDVRVTDSSGAALAHRTRRYGDWLNIDLDRAPLPSDGVVQLDYEVLHAVRIDGDAAVLEWNLLGLVWNLPVTTLELELVAPSAPNDDAVSIAAEYDYSAYAGDGPRIDGRSIRWATTGPLDRDRELIVRARVPSEGIAPTPDYLRELMQQAGLPIAIAALLILLAPLLRLLPPIASVQFTRFWNALCGAVVVYSMLPSLRYWLAEDHYRGGDASNVIASVVGDIGLLTFVLLFVWRQDRWLARGERAAYFTQLALPVFLAFPAPMYEIYPSYLFLPLMGVPLALYWARRRLAFHFGAGTHVIAEQVGSAGEISLAELARAVRVPRRQLARILARSPDLPLVADFEHGVVYSSEVAALRENFSICPNCGGGTETKGMAMLACGYCDRELASRMKADVAKPVPVLVEALARVTQAFGLGVLAFAGLLAVVFVLISIMDADSEGLIALVLPAVLALFGWWVTRVGSQIRDGKRYRLLSTALLVMSPLVIPLVARLRLRGRLIDLHFGRYRPDELVRLLGERGQLTFTELAEHLDATETEAVELARYLCAHGVIDAVFDRVGRRVVHRSRYRELAARGSCQNCGGLLGIIAGRTACHYCGEPA